MTTAIKVEHISKKYVIRHQSREKYTALRDVVVNSVKNIANGLIQKPSKSTNKTKEDFYALNDVSFEIKQGERVGIIGRNGAGKSTLLKLLSRITEPSSGKISMNGRVASLLEVGTGFHPELTGRENIFMNGSILGMRRTEIRAKFDEIVAFAEVERFLDTPVKRYSSGMYVRLAFAVAAHLEPEILLVDEVLAVGDAEFQKKCLGKMEDVAKNQGRTVLFVSHNMSAISTLCSTCLLLDKGVLLSMGATEKIIQQYLKGGVGGDSLCVSWVDKKDMPGDDVVTLHGIYLVDHALCPLTSISIDQRIGVQIHFEIIQEGYGPSGGIILSTTKGEMAFLSHQPNKNVSSEMYKKGHYTTTAWIPENLLNVGMYSLSVGFASYNPSRPHMHVADVIHFETFEDINKRPVDYPRPIPGILRPLLEWVVEKKSSSKA